MKYELIEDDVFELDGADYITLDITEYENEKYCFTNKLLTEDEPSNEFIVFKMNPDGLVKEKNEKVLGEVLRVFSANMNKKIEYLNNFKNKNESEE